MVEKARDSVIFLSGKSQNVCQIIYFGTLTKYNVTGEVGFAESRST